MKNSQFYALLLAVMISPRMSTLGAFVCAVFYLGCMFLAMWREAD